MKYDFTKHEYKTFSEFVMCFILSGGKLSERDYTRFTGFGGLAARIRVKQFNGKSEYNKAKQQQYISPSGAHWDTFVKEYNDDPGSPGSIDEMDGINEICEVLQLTRPQMKSKLQVSVIDQSENYYSNFSNFFTHCTNESQIKTAYRWHYMQHGTNAVMMAEINQQFKQALFPETVERFDLSILTKDRAALIPLNTFTPMAIEDF